MQQSKRISGLNGEAKDDGWGLFVKARRMVAAGEDVTELTIGEHDIKTDPRILDAMYAATKAGHTGYAMVMGIDALRDAVAARVEAASGVKTTRDNVQITPGGQAGLFMSHHAALDEGDKALFIDPYYATYPGTIRAVGGQPCAIATRSRDGFQPQAEAIAAEAADAKSLLINTPNNPTGAVYSRDTLEGIAQVVRDHDLWLISDEVYDTQIWQGAHISPRSLPGMEGHVMQVGSMSKSHAMTGSRLGWVVAPEEVIHNMNSLANTTNYGVAAFVQHAGVYALGLGAALEEQVAAPFRRRRDIIMRLVEAQNVVRVLPADGAMYAMLDIRATGMSGDDFGDALLEAEKIAVMPGESFGQSASGHIRVAMTVEDERFEEAVARLLRFAAEKAAERV